LFGKRSVTILRGVIQGVETHGGGSRTTLVVRSTAETVEFKTNVATAEQARNICLPERWLCRVNNLGWEYQSAFHCP
jgi:hypothetical protein